MISHPNCKINLGLHVMRRRSDGYHDLETVFVPVPLCDTLDISPAESFSFTQDGIALDGDTESNLVVKSYRLMQKEFGKRIPVCDIRLTKNIPTGAGLGGGSSDAAFTIKMLNTLSGLGLPTTTMEALAARLGADCAFFINNQTAFATGIGDHLTPLGFNPLSGYRLLMVKPDEAVSTAEAYGGITPREQRSDIQPCDLINAVKRPAKEWNQLVVNDFEETVFVKHPQLAAIKQALYASGALYAAMSGSGSTIYGIFGPDAAIDHHFNCNTYTFKL